jgi:hypothetical protein
MDWLNAHAELFILLFSIIGAVGTFTAWNVSQGLRLKAAEDALEAQRIELAAIKAKQDSLAGELFAELRRIGEKLAHIEGFLHHASKGASKVRA